MELETISAENLKDKIEHAANVTVVCVLSKKYYDDCHIKGSINAPLDQILTISDEWDRTREIIVYCASKTCSVSKKAYNMLIEKGFKNIKAYEGGTKEWKKLDYNCAGNCEMNYLK